MPAALSEDAGLPRDVYALLAQANLLRMRGSWDEAVTNCMDALRLAPDSPSAQSLLGDIYENQGRFDDAIQWYRMALDANPESPADHLKLDRLLQRQKPPLRTERNAGAAEPHESPLPKVSSSQPASHNAPAPLWTRFRQNPEISLRYGARVAAVLVCLVVVLAYAAIHRRAALATLGLAPSQEVKTAPVVLPPPLDPSGDVKTADVPRDIAEQTALNALRLSTDLNGKGIIVDDVQFDPRSGRVIVTVSLLAEKEVTRAVVLRSMLNTAQAAAATSPSTATFTLRCLMAQEVQPSAPPESTTGATLVFVGDVSPDALPSGVGGGLDDAHVLALFTNPWWSPQIPS